MSVPACAARTAAWGIGGGAVGYGSAKFFQDNPKNDYASAPLLIAFGSGAVAVALSAWEVATGSVIAEHRAGASFGPRAVATVAVLGASLVAGSVLGVRQHPSQQ